MTASTFLTSILHLGNTSNSLKPGEQPKDGAELLSLLIPIAMEAVIARAASKPGTMVKIGKPLDYLADYLAEGSASALRRRLNRQTHAYEIDAVMILLSAIPTHAGCRLLNGAIRNSISTATVKRFMKELQEEVAFRREEISQDALAKIVGISPSTISKWEAYDEVRLLLKLLRLVNSQEDGRHLIYYALKTNTNPLIEKIPHKRYAIESLIKPEGLVCISGSAATGKTLCALAPLVRAALKNSQKATGLFMGKGADELKDLLPSETKIKSQINPASLFTPKILTCALEQYICANPYKSNDSFFYHAVVRTLLEVTGADDPFLAASEKLKNDGTLDDRVQAILRSILDLHFGPKSQYSAVVSSAAPRIEEFVNESLLTLPDSGPADFLTHLITAAFVEAHPKQAPKGFLVVLDGTGAIDYGRQLNPEGDASTVWSMNRSPVFVCDQHPIGSSTSHVLMNASCILFRQTMVQYAVALAGEEDAKTLSRLPTGEALIRAPRYSGRELVPLSPLTA